MSETVESLPIESPLSSTDSEDAKDDRDMLMISNADHLPSPDPKPEGETNSPEPPSTGQASRMDYQALFEQLRNIPTDK